MLDVEERILCGDCEDCDWDPIQCLSCGICHYETEEADNDEVVEFAFLENFER